jgi:copper chaperone CopZ
MTIRNERLRIEGMHCGGCETAIEDALGAMAGVKTAKADLTEARLVVRSINKVTK